MSQTLLEVDGIGMLFESSAFFPILGIHILAGLLCVVTGIISSGGRFLRSVMPGTHRPKTKLADLDQHTHHFYGLLIHCHAHRLLRRGRRDLTRYERVAGLKLLVLARPGRNAFHRSRTFLPPAEISVCGGKARKVTLVFVIRCMTRPRGATMATAEESLMKRLAVYTTLAVLAHAVIVVWHLFVLAKVPPGLTGHQVLSATFAINVAPLVGLVLLWNHYPRLASILIFVPLAGGFSAGGFEHFLSNGPNNVFRMVATEWSVPFKISAVFLILLELGACWLCVRLFGKARPGRLQN
jgi:hypothetical protein